MGGSPKFSFVMPAYKGMYLREAINGILSQTYKSFELIIVDDCSPEDLKSIVDCFPDERVSYFKNEQNIGGHDLVRQWNNSLRHASGEYVILASDDDVYDCTFLAEIDAMSIEYPGASLLRPRVRYIDGQGNELSVEKEQTRGFCDRNSFLALMSAEEIYSGIPQYVFRRDELARIGGFVNFPIAWFSDDATVIEMSANGVAISDKILFNFRKSEISISTGHQSFLTLRKKILAADKYYKYLLDNVSIPIDYRDRFIDRIRRQTYYLIKDSEIITAMKCITFIHECDNNDLFPVNWQFKSVISAFKKLFSN